MEDIYTHTKKLPNGEEDKLEWIPLKFQGFQVKGYYKTQRR